MRNMDGDFRTFRGYSLEEQRKEGSLTPSMEDYLEMIYRLASERGFARVSDLAEALNVQPPSVSRAARRLTDEGLLQSQPYGVLQLTQEGMEIGEILLRRHELVYEFLGTLGCVENRLADTERVEHLLSDETLRKMALLVDFVRDNRAWWARFETFVKSVRDPDEACDGEDPANR